MGSSIQRIDRKIQRGRGKAAKKLGQPYSVYRLNSKSNNSVVSGSPVLAGFRCRVRRITKKDAIENELFSLQIFKGTCDNLALQPGDVLVETGYKSQQGDMFTFAQDRPTRESLFVRTDKPAQLSRPTPGAGNPSQQPAEGFVFIDAYGGTSAATDEVLTLQNGVYAFSDDEGAEPATVPVCVQQLNRVHAEKDLGTPTDQPESRFLVWIPPMGGEQPQEHDRIKCDVGDSYQIDSIYPATAGLIGYVCIASKRGAA